MPIAITDGQLSALSRACVRRLASKLASNKEHSVEAQVFENYIDECVGAGVHHEVNVVRLTMLLLEIDGIGARPEDVSARLADAEVGERLKTFQVAYAWHKFLTDKGNGGDGTRST